MLKKFWNSALAKISTRQNQAFIDFAEIIADLEPITHTVETNFSQIPQPTSKPKNSLLAVEKVVESCGQTVDNSVEEKELPEPNVKLCKDLCRFPPQIDGRFRQSFVQKGFQGLA